jgi:hypothetical protein
VLCGYRNDGSELRFDVLRWVLVGCQVTTLLLTWPLWLARLEPPHLPAFWWPLPEFGVGYPLLATLALTLVVPRWGILCHAVLLVLSFGMDQSRLLPQVISCGILLLSTLPSPTLRTIGWTHLVAMWFFAGIHKLLSSAYYDGSPTLRWALEDLFFGGHGAPKTLVVTLGVGGAVLEMCIASLTLFRRTRRLACIVACLLHAGVLLALVRNGWNQSVWSWNVAVVAAVFALLWHREDSVRQAWGRISLRARAVVLFLLLSPLGFYIECMDAYLAHCLYAQNVPRGIIVRQDKTESRSIGLSQQVKAATGTDLPPEHRLYEAYVRRSQTTRPGDYLLILDPRLGAKARGRDQRLLYFNEQRQLVEPPVPVRARVRELPPTRP